MAGNGGPNCAIGSRYLVELSLSLFFHYQGISRDLPSSSKDELKAAMPHWDEFSSEALHCLSLGTDELDIPSWRYGSHEWLNLLYQHLNPPRETYATPAGENEWVVRKLPYNLFKSSVMLIEILLERGDYESVNPSRSVGQESTGFGNSVPVTESEIDSSGEGEVQDTGLSLHGQKRTRIPRTCDRSQGARWSSSGTAWSCAAWLSAAALD